MENLSEKGLIKTKYSRPETNRYLISRRRLHQKLNHSLMSKLTMVIAPAGYGKTSAVLDWLGKCGTPAAWLSVDSCDNNPLVFWRYVSTALDSISKGISKNTEYVFSSPELLKSNIHTSILIDRLSEVKEDFLFVLDDLHLINDSSILNGLSYLIDFLPAKMHLIIISRTEPELGLARHRIRWQAQILGEIELCFKDEELFQFYKARGFTLNNKDIQKIKYCSEGWPASLVAIAMSMEATHGNIADSIRYCRQDIDQYLRDEVYSTWRPEKKEFALKTIILDTLSAPLCDAVTGNNNGYRMLKEISGQNGFLIALNDEKEEYRYHPLFKDFLNKLMLESYTGDISELHRKAAACYRKQENWSKAIDHYLNGCSYKEAVKLIEDCTHYYVNKNDFFTLCSWANRLPEEYKEYNFKIALAYTGYYTCLNQLDLAWKWIAAMEEAVVRDKHSSDPDFRGYARTVSGLSILKMYVLEGKISKAFLQAKTISEQNEDKYFISAGYIDFNEADIYFYRCPINKIVMIYNRSSDEYIEFIKNYRKMISKNPGYAPLAVGEYLYESNRLEEAIPYILEALEEARTAKCYGVLVPAMIDLARIKRAKGDISGAFEALGECEKKLETSGKAHWIYMLQAFRCRLYMDIKETGETGKWLDTCKLDKYTEISRIKEFELLIYARTLLEKGALNDAKLMLQRLLIFCEGTGRLHSKVEVLNLLAILEHKRGNMAYAVNYIEKSLVIGLKEGYIRSYVDEQKAMVGLLKQYCRYFRKKEDREDIEALATFAGNLLKQTQENLRTISAAYGEAAASGLEALLTEQEKKVLEMLIKAHTSKEISDQLGIGLRTVKTHIGNIYGKLGVKNRVQCSMLVYEAGFLEPPKSE